MRLQDAQCAWLPALVLVGGFLLRYVFVRAGQLSDFSLSGRARVLT